MNTTAAVACARSRARANRQHRSFAMANDDTAPTVTPAPQITPPDLDKPFDPDTLPPHLRAKLDRISAIRMRMLEILVEDDDDIAAEADAAALAAHTQAPDANPTTAPHGTPPVSE